MHSFDSALRECGVTETTLSGEEKDRLDREGYLLFQLLIDPIWLEELRAGFDAAADDETCSKGTRHVEATLYLDAPFARIYQHPRLLAAAHHVLGRPFRLGQLHGREPLSGFGGQGLHADARPRSRSEPYGIVTAMVMLDDFTLDNGATRIVSRTHVSLGPPPKSVAEPGRSHPDEVVVTAPAGSVLLFNGHLWHSGTRNRAQLRRRGVQLSFVALDAPWHVDLSGGKARSRSSPRRERRALCRWDRRAAGPGSPLSIRRETCGSCP